MKLELSDPSTAAVVEAVEASREKHGEGSNQLPFVSVVGNTVTVCMILVDHHHQQSSTPSSFTSKHCHPYHHDVTPHQSSPQSSSIIDPSPTINYRHHH
jgi:hypothetical protein